MDGSDRLKQIQANVIWNNYAANLSNIQPRFNNTSLISTINTAYFTYPDYATKDFVASGRVWGPSTIDILTSTFTKCYLTEPQGN
jgi:hypothetical protein